eukprot:928460-Prorocentrum_minimum.AAC.2
MIRGIRRCSKLTADCELQRHDHARILIDLHRSEVPQRLVNCLNSWLGWGTLTPPAAVQRERELALRSLSYSRVLGCSSSTRGCAPWRTAISRAFFPVMRPAEGGWIVHRVACVARVALGWRDTCGNRRLVHLMWGRFCVDAPVVLEPPSL